MQHDISVTIGKAHLKSPLIIGANDQVVSFDSFELIAQNTKHLGAFVTKSFTINSRVGNKDPIVCCLENNVLVSSGMRNPGAHQMLADISKYQDMYGNAPLLIASIASDPINAFCTPEEELSSLALRLCDCGTRAIELNLSCPNLNTPEILANRSGMIYSIITNIKKTLIEHGYDDCTLIAKLAGDTQTLLKTTKQAKDAGADAVSILPILRATSFYTGLLQNDNNESLNPGDYMLGNTHGTIYGSGLGSITRYMVLGLKEHISIPIIASGGCLCGMNNSILEKTDGFIQTMFAGATAIEVVSAFYPFNRTKILEIDMVVDEYCSYINKNNIKCNANLS